MPEAVLATVTVTLGSRPYVLTPAVDRLRVLNRLQGGFLALFRAVANLDGDTMALVIAAGAGLGRLPSGAARPGWGGGAWSSVRLF